MASKKNSNVYARTFPGISCLDNRQLVEDVFDESLCDLMIDEFVYDEKTNCIVFNGFFDHWKSRYRWTK